MATKSDERPEQGDRLGDDAGAHGGRGRDAEAARRSFEADERAAEAGRSANGTAGKRWGDWNAVGLVTSFVATGLFSVGGVLARSTQLTTVALFSLAAVAVLLVRRGGRRLY